MRVLIVGGGPAAWTAALYCARAALNTTVFEGALDGTSLLPGGQLMTTTDVENYPGVPNVLGSDLVENMKEQATSFGAKCVPETVARIDADNKRLFTKQQPEAGHPYDALILATGASAKYLGLQSEARFLNRGVSACATCDGALPRFRHQPLVVVGGGDTAMEEALFLTKFATMVHIVHRGPAFTKASAIMVERARQNPRIQAHFNVTVKDIVGSEEHGVSAVELSSGVQIQCKGVFVAIGHSPNSQLFGGDKDAQGYIVPKKFTHTSVPGIFAAGDVVDHRYRQAITAAASGCQAAIDVSRWLETLK